MQVSQRLLNRAPGRLRYALESLQFNRLRLCALPVLLELLKGECHGRIEVTANGEFALALDVFGFKRVNLERAPAPAVDTVLAQLQPFMTNAAGHRDAQVTVAER